MQSAPGEGLLHTNSAPDALPLLRPPCHHVETLSSPHSPAVQLRGLPSHLPGHTSITPAVQPCHMLTCRLAHLPHPLLQLNYIGGQLVPRPLYLHSPFLCPSLYKDILRWVLGWGGGDILRWVLGWGGGDILLHWVLGWGARWGDIRLGSCVRCIYLSLNQL